VAVAVTEAKAEAKELSSSLEFEFVLSSLPDQTPDLLHILIFGKLPTCVNLPPLEKVKKAFLALNGLPPASLYSIRQRLLYSI
jgi:hypothetical protein